MSSKIKYYSATKLMAKAKEVMIPLENQLTAQRQIATLIAMHLNKIQALNRGASPNEIVSASAFLAGSTGSGKSYIIKSLAEICGLHFRQIDTASITQAGVRGKNLSHCLDEIYEEDKAFFEDGGILNLDEVDKTFFKNDPHYDAYSPQQDFLKLMEGGNYTYTVDNRTRTINLDRTLILLSGACANITKILKRKHCERVTMGFSNGTAPAKTTIEDYASLITLEDLVSYGMMAELASRVNTVIHIPKINLDGYKMLITAEAKSSAVNKFKNHFAMRGIQFDISSDAIDFIAADSVKRDVGARSVLAILNENLLDAYRIADDNRSYNRIQLVVTPDGKLDVEYFEGDRLAAPIFRKQHFAKDFSLIRECANEENINRFCDEFTQAANLFDVTDERLVYYFLQTACRFMANEVRPTERCFASLLKLADASKVTSNNSDYMTPYDIICSDVKKHLADATENKDDAQIQLTVFSHYYSAFRAESRKRPNMHTVLVKALETAGQYYSPLDRYTRAAHAL